MSETLILSHEAIALKLDRIAWQILEHHHEDSSIVLVGLVDRGSDVAQKIKNRLENFSTKKIQILRIDLDKSNALASDIELKDSESIRGNSVILIDDVLNSGTTMAAAFMEVLKYGPKSVKTAVLANRDHHKFPIQANYVGISMATTLKEHISYTEENGKMSVTLS